MPRPLKFMADYHCWPLWDPVEPTNVDPGTLPLSAELLADLADWQAAFDSTLVPHNPAASGFPGPVQAEAFRKEGLDLWRRLQAELGDDWSVEHPAEAEFRRYLFGRVVDYERRCAEHGGTHRRSYVGTAEGVAAGFAWVPVELPEVPLLDATRVVELAGPDGATLLFIPLDELDGLLRQAVEDQRWPPEALRPLASLEPESAEVAVHSLWDLVAKLARAIPAA
jgi:hypothetical protein